jgi:hypothetical protein
MRKIKWFSIFKIFFLVMLLLTGCSSFAKPTEATQPTTDLPTQAQQETPVQSIASTPTVQVFLPEIQGGNQETPAALIPTAEPTPAPTLTPAPIVPASQLAFLMNKDLWLASVPDGGMVQLTKSGDLLSFAWSPDGSMIATYNGHNLCGLQPDGAPVGKCIDLELDDEQAIIERHIVWSPNQKTLVLWNVSNPWDETAIGWIIVYRDGSGTIIKITDPVDWGLSAAPNNEPGGVTGQAIFLSDGSLLGTLSHRWLCGTGGCHYQLYRFDLTAKIFLPYPNKPEEGWSEGSNLYISKDQQMLVNFGNFNASCDTAVAFLDLYDLASSTRKLFNLNQEALDSLAISPDSSQLILSRMAACSSQSQSWDHSCGLSQGNDILPMQRLDLASEQRSDLAPGVSPVWSPDSLWIAFRSCLGQNSSGSWEPSGTTAPAIYAMSPDGSGLRLVSEGDAPAWKP